MRIKAIDFFYLSMPQVLDIGDGSQDALLVRLEAGDYVGWGECEAAPLVSIASLVCPMSHSACKPVQASVLGQTLENVDDIIRIGNLVRENSMDLLQADHTLSGIDTAMWDLLGKARSVPVYELLGYRQAFPKTPYASVLFGDTPQETLEKARHVRCLGYRAGKFGWGAFGKGSVQADIDQVVAAREGLGEDGILLIDAGTVWKDDIEQASQRLQVLRDCRVTWLEEPFVSGALDAYRQLATLSDPVKLAGGEGAHNYHIAQQMIDYAEIGFIQVDAGRIGGIGVAKRVADYAQTKKVTYVNHTFTSHLALSASLQPYAGVERDSLCEYPVDPKPLAVEMTKEHLVPDSNVQIRLPDAPGLGITPDLEAIAKYLVDVMIYPDIDLFIPKVSIAQLFQIGGQLASSDMVFEVVFQKSRVSNLPGGLYLKPRIEYGDWGRPWKIDIWSVDDAIIDQNMAVMQRFKDKMTELSIFITG